MKNIPQVIDGKTKIYPSDTNSARAELGRVVKFTRDFDDNSITQLSESIENLNSIFYKDLGIENNVTLSRETRIDAGNIETLFNGASFYFSPANTNTGASTLKLNQLDKKPIRIDGQVLKGGELVPNELYFARYDQLNDVFEVGRVSAKRLKSVSPSFSNIFIKGYPDNGWSDMGEITVKKTGRHHIYFNVRRQGDIAQFSLINSFRFFAIKVKDRAKGTNEIWTDDEPLFAELYYGTMPNYDNAVFFERSPQRRYGKSLLERYNMMPFIHNRTMVLDLKAGDVLEIKNYKVADPALKKNKKDDDTLFYYITKVDGFVFDIL